jgi:hypothetical protein
MESPHGQAHLPVEAAPIGHWSRNGRGVRPTHPGSHASRPVPWPPTARKHHTPPGRCAANHGNPATEPHILLPPPGAPKKTQQNRADNPYTPRFRPYTPPFRPYTPPSRALYAPFPGLMRPRSGLIRPLPGPYTPPSGPYTPPSPMFSPASRPPGGALWPHIPPIPGQPERLPARARRPTATRMAPNCLRVRRTAA